MTTATQPQHYTSKVDQKRLADDITAYYDIGINSVKKIVLNGGFPQYEKEWVVARGLRPYRTRWVVYNDDQTLVGSPFVLYEYTTMDKEGKVVVAVNDGGGDDGNNGQRDKRKHLILMNYPGVSRQCLLMHSQYKLMALLHRYILESFYGVVIDAVWLLSLGEHSRYDNSDEQYAVVEVAPDDQLLAMALDVIHRHAVPKTQPRQSPLITKYEQFCRDRDVYAELENDVYRYQGNKYGNSSPSSSCTIL
jgi:hypothetical protein